MGGTKVNAPAPTPEENALRASQTDLLRQQTQILQQQQQQQRQFLPYFASQLGIDLQYDANGNIIGGTQSPEQARINSLKQQALEKSLNQMLHPESDPLYALQQKLYQGQLDQFNEEAKLNPQRLEIEKALLDRQQKALAGTLDVDPALERSIAEQKRTLQDKLRGQFGSGWETSSPGIEALQRFDESATVLRSQAQHDQLTLAEQLGIAQLGANTALTSAGVDATQKQIPGINPLATGGFAFGLGQGGLQNNAQLGQVLGAPMSISSALGGVAQGYQLPIGQLQNTRQMQLDASIANAKNSMAGLGAIGGVFGSILGAI